MNEHRMTLSKWYGSSVRIPDYESFGYVRFLASCVGLVNSVCERKLGKKVYVRFVDGGTAAADQDNGVILLNEGFCKGVFGEGKKQLPVEQTISAILGILVHEAAHFAYSPTTLAPWSDHVKAHTAHKFVPQVARTLGNIIEDTYIESKVGRKVPNLYWMLESAREVMFRKHDVRQRIKRVAGITDAPHDEDALANVLSALIVARLAPNLDKVSPYISNLFSLVMESETAEDIQERLDLGLEVYNELMRNLGKVVSSTTEGSPEGEDKVENKETGNNGEAQGSEMGEGGLGEEESRGASSGDGDEGEDGEGESGDETDSSGKTGTAPAPSLDEVEKDSQGLNVDHNPAENDFKKRLTRPSENVFGANNVLESMRRFNLLPSQEEGEYDPNEGMVVEMSAEIGTAIQMDKRYVLLAEMGRQRATVNKPYGEDRKRGSNIRRLHRIATDGKIFAERVPMNDYRPMQVAILVDCSGSMTVPTVVNGRREARMDFAAEAALGASYGLMEARCQVALYGHTADGLLSQRETLVYNIKEFQQGMERVPERLGWLVNSAIHSNNRDNVAIKHVAAKFTDRQRKRLLIVISDGSPAAAGYHGHQGRDATRDTVDEVRKQGIDVLSISITAEAKTANDYIYGAEHNVFNNDPNVIEEVIQRLLTQ